MSTTNITLYTFNGSLKSYLGDERMQQVFYVQGSTKPSLQVTLLDQDGNIVDLSSTTVTFSLIDAITGSLVINSGSCTVDASAGTVTYDWSATDLENPGKYIGEFKITYTADSTVHTVYDLIEVDVRKKVA